MIHLQDLLRATGGRVRGSGHVDHFSGFAYDSRILEPGELFLAVKTAKADGHDYILDACHRGAAGVLCERPPDRWPETVTCIVVPDVREALTDWARYILRKLAPDVIGVTGSTGKTTTREAVAKVLCKRYRVFRNPGNANDRYGLPIALGRLEAEHEKAVLEMASDHYDEIRELAAITRPRIGVVTSVSAVHTETLGTLDDIAQEKGRLVEALPADGYAILNRDDPRVHAMAERTSATVWTYGLAMPEESTARSIWADGIVTGKQGIAFTVHLAGHKARIQMRLLGRHNVYVGLVACLVGHLCGVPLSEAAEALAALEPVPGRLNPLAGQGDTLLLDDTYNATPAATLAALETLADIPARQRIAVLGDMPELGEGEETWHREVGRRAYQVADLVITVGERARWIAEEAQAIGLASDQVLITYTIADALQHLRKVLMPGDAVLIKGASNLRLEQITRALMAEPSKAPRRLVRQEPVWERVRLVTPGRPTWVEIDLDAIAGNVRFIKERVGADVAVMGVLKADAYGHGAVKVARTALNNGAAMVGVACLGEAITLRQAGIEAPILVLGYTPPWQAREMILHKVTATVFSMDVAEALDRAAGQLRAKAAVHIKVDTGMGRLGLLPDQILEFIQDVAELPNLQLQGIFTHFAAADEADKAYTHSQLERFQEVLDKLDRAGFDFSHVHAANSAAILDLPETHFDMVRLGIAMYGLHPSPNVQWPEALRPALTFKTIVAQVKSLPAGSFVSYGCTYCTPRLSRIAVIPVGYADGFRRAPSHWGHVLVRGQRAPIVGRVCMDQTMIDVTDIPGVREGDEVVLIGQQGGEEILVEDVAERLGTINYEVISEILARVPRVS
jgi:alanine racemase